MCLIFSCKETNTNPRLQPRTRDEKKVTETNKQKSSASEEVMDTIKANSEDIYEFKSAKDSGLSPDNKNTDTVNVNVDVTDPSSTPITQIEEGQKRNFSEISDANEESGNDEETKRKKRKDESTKEIKSTTPQRTGNPIKGQANKQITVTQSKSNLLNTTKCGMYFYLTICKCDIIII